jgi:hypothetical protein
LKKQGKCNSVSKIYKKLILKKIVVKLRIQYKKKSSFYNVDMKKLLR